MTIDKSNLDQNYLNILSEIKNEIDLTNLIPEKLVPTFCMRDMSLLDILNVSDSEAYSYRGFGNLKMELLAELQDELVNNKDKFINYYNNSIIKNNDVDPEYNKILSAIKNKEDLMVLVPSKLVNVFIQKEMSLLDVLNVTDYEASTFRGFGKSKIDLLHKFQDELNENKKKFIDYYYYNLVDLVLPFDFDPEQDIIKNTYQTIKDFFQIYEKRETKDYKRKIEFWSNYYGVFDEPLEISEFYAGTNLTKERVRQIIQNDSPLKTLFQGKSVGNIKVNEEIISQIKEIKQRKIYRAGFCSDISNNESISVKRAKHIAELFSLELIEIDDKGKFLINENETLMFREHYRALVQTINKETLPFEVEQVVRLASENYKNSEPFNETIIYALLENKTLFESIEDDDEVIRYQIKWHLTSSQDTKIKRILYENGDKMHANDILTEYNRRCLLAGLDEISKDKLFIKGDNHLKTFGKTGYWQFYENVEDAIELDNAWVIIEDFIKSKNGLARLEEIKQELLNKNLIYPDGSIRAYTSPSCFIGLNDPDLFIHIDYKDQYPDIPVRQKYQANLGNNFIKTAINILQERKQASRRHLITMVISKLSENEITLRRGPASFYVDKFLDIGIFIEHEANGIKTIILDEEELKEHNIEELGKQKEPAYRSAIRSQAIQFLKSSKEYSASMEELWEELKEIYPSNIVKNNFYKIFNDNNLFEKFGKNSSRYVRLITELLPEPQEYTIEVEEPVEPTVEQVEQVEKHVPAYSTEPVQRKAFIWEELREQIVKEVSKDYNLSDDMIELGLDTLYYAAYVDGKVTRWGNHLFQSIYELWFTKTDYYDRDVCFQKLTTNYETYLSKLIENNGDKVGLANLIESSPALAELRQYKFESKEMEYWQIDQTKRNYSYFLGSLIYYRNLYSHDNDNENLELSLNNLIKQVTDFIALYVYTGYLLCN